MKKLERMDGRLFDSLKANELAILSSITGAEKVTSYADGKPNDTNFTSSQGQGASVDKILADSSSYCDDSCLDSYNGASMPIIMKQDSDGISTYYFDNREVTFEIQ